MAKQPVRDRTDYDSPWKDVIEDLFPHFLRFFYPELAGQIDWDRPYTFLDKELQSISRKKDKKGRRYVDKLVRVYLLDGQEEWLLIHIEVQSDRDDLLPRRMFVYNYRIFERYGREVVSLAVLGDLESDWLPRRFAYGRAGAEMSLTFLVAKLLEIEENADLETIANPFALVTLAHLSAKRTSGSMPQRMRAKLRLFRLALKRGMSREEIRRLVKFIDWVMILPENLDKQILETLNQEEEAVMQTHMPIWEREAHANGKKEGKQEGKQEGKLEGKQEGKLEGKLEALMLMIETRFGEIPEWVPTKVGSADETALSRWLKALMLGKSLEYSLASCANTHRERTQTPLDSCGERQHDAVPSVEEAVMQMQMPIWEREAHAKA
jgi:hypothetical protein